MSMLSAPEAAVRASASLAPNALGSEPAPQRPRSAHLPTTIASVSYLVALVAVGWHYMSASLFRTWFFNSDEYVFAAEIIRFCSGDFRQQFFDIPGTLYMLLNALVWSAYYGGAVFFGATNRDATLPTFTFQNLDALFVLMRGTTLVFFLLSIVLVFVWVARASNRASAAVAALLLLMSPIYASYSSFVRTESMAVVLMVASMLLLWRTLDRRGDVGVAGARVLDGVFAAGFLGGLAAAARFHALTAVLPALVLIAWTSPHARWPSYPPGLTRAMKILLPGAVMIAVGVLAYATFAPTDTPAASRFFQRVMTASLGVTLVGVVLYLVPSTRSWIVRLASPDVIKLGIGAGIGMLAGTPTLITQYSFFFRSIQSYSTYVDLERMNWLLWDNVAWYLQHYVRIIAPDLLTLILLGTGSLLVLVTRDRKMVPVLAAAALFFVSKPISLRAEPHHVMLWLPFFFALCGYPVGTVCRALAAHRNWGRPLGAVALAIFLSVCMNQLTNGLQQAAAATLLNEARLKNVERATVWLKQHAEQNATIAISYFCFNSDAFFQWLKSLQVPIPVSVLDNREYVIWWGHQSALSGKVGYVCATPGDVQHMKHGLDLSSPGEGTNPYADQRFAKAETFGSGADQVDIFRFNYRAAPKGQPASTHTSR
jgi:hypothetical protein